MLVPLVGGPWEVFEHDEGRSLCDEPLSVEARRRDLYQYRLELLFKLVWLACW